MNKFSSINWHYVNRNQILWLTIPKKTLEYVLKTVLLYPNNLCYEQSQKYLPT